MADYTSPEEEEVFSEEEIKLPLDEYEEEKAENEAANNDADGQFRIAESANDQVNDWQDQNCWRRWSVANNDFLWLVFGGIFPIYE